PVASVIFLLIIFGVSVWNGAGFYIEVFGRKFERELEALRKELAETRSSAVSHASSPVATPNPLPADHDHGFMSSGVSVSSEISGMDEASSEGMGSPIMIGGPGKELDMKEGFKLDVVPDSDEPKKDRAMDIWTALNRLLALERLSSTNHLDAVLTQLARDVDIKRYGMGSVVSALVDHDFRLFEAPCAESPSALPQPHFSILQQLGTTISTLEGIQEVPEGILRLCSITEAIGAALVALAAFGRKGGSAKSSKVSNRHQQDLTTSADDSLYHSLGVSPPRSIDDASTTAGILRRRLSNTLKVYLEYSITRSTSSFLRHRFVQCFNEGGFSRSIQHHPDDLSPEQVTALAPSNVLSFLGDSVEPGRWLIVLAQRALRHLRQLITRHHVMYKLFTRKIEYA
ncbi:hypothetical protein FRC00_009701, partial [Tulasnella sp. 408]